MLTRRTFILVLAMFLLVPSGFATLVTYVGSGGSIPDQSTFTSDIVIVDPYTVINSGQNVFITLYDLSHIKMGQLMASLQFVGSAVPASYFFYEVGNTKAGDQGKGKGDESNFSGDYGFNNDYTGDLWAAAAAGGNNDVVAGGNYFPTGALSANEIAFSDLWNGLSIAGTWRLSVADNKKDDTGSIGSWELAFNVNETVVPEPSMALPLAAALLGAFCLIRRRRRA